MLTLEALAFGLDDIGQVFLPSVIKPWLYKPWSWICQHWSLLTLVFLSLVWHLLALALLALNGLGLAAPGGVCTYGLGFVVLPPLWPVLVRQWIPLVGICSKWFGLA